MWVGGPFLEAECTGGQTLWPEKWDWGEARPLVRAARKHCDKGDKWKVELRKEAGGQQQYWATGQRGRKQVSGHDLGQSGPGGEGKWLASGNEANTWRCSLGAQGGCWVPFGVEPTVWGGNGPWSSKAHFCWLCWRPSEGLTVFTSFTNLSWEGMAMSSETSHRPFEVWCEQALSLISYTCPSPGLHPLTGDTFGDKTPLKEVTPISYMSNSGGHHIAEWPSSLWVTGCHCMRLKLPRPTSCLSRIFFSVLALCPTWWSAAPCFLNHSPYIVVAVAGPMHWVLASAHSFIYDGWYNHGNNPKGKWHHYPHFMETEETEAPKG